jgi:ABC-type transporter Mla MlaB component
MRIGASSTVLDWKKMAQNFKISIHRKIDNLSIRLMGDFDGNSAWELINAIRENLNNSKFIQIDTSNLKKVYPFGREVLKSNLLIVKDRRIRIQFSGPNALRIAPQYTNLR